jgi:hypothetical protein
MRGESKNAKLIMQNAKSRLAESSTKIKPDGPISHLLDLD